MPSTRRNFVKMFDADKTRMIGLAYGEKNYDNNMLSRFHLLLERDGQTDRQTEYIAIMSVCPSDGQTDIIAISIPRVNAR